MRIYKNNNYHQEPIKINVFGNESLIATAGIPTKIFIIIYDKSTQFISLTHK